MQNFGIGVCAVVMAILLCFSGVQIYEFNEMKEKITMLQAQKDEAEAYEDKLRQELADAQRYASNLKKRISLLSGVQPGIHKGHLRRVIQATLTHLGVPPGAQPDWEKLLLLTAATESDMGYLLRQIKGPARGIFQIEPQTEKSVLLWFKTFDPTAYEKICALRFPARLNIHEMECNISYCCAIAWGTYATRKVNPVGKTLQEMAELYKRHFNTFLGKGTIRGALQKAQVFASLS